MAILKLTIIASLLLATQDSGKQQQIEQARRALRDAEARLLQVDQDVDKLRLRIRQERSRVNALQAEAERLDRESAELERQLVQAQQRISDVQARAESAAAELAAQKESQSAAEARVQSINEQLVAAKQALFSDFEQSDPLLAASGRVDEKQRAVDDAVNVVKTKTADDAEYQKLLAAAQVQKEKLTALRSQAGVDPAILAGASQDWMNAENAANKYIGAAVDSDSLVKAARSELADAQRARHGLRTEFEASIKNDESIKTLESERSAAAAEQTEARRRVATLSGTVKTAQGELVRLQTIINRGATDAAERRRLAELRRREAQDIMRRFDLLDLELQRKLSQRELARRQVQEAAERLRRLLEK